MTSGNWIWIDRENEPNQYACFRRTFDLQNMPSHAEITISADTDFILWVNGCQAGRGQFPDYASEKTYSVFDISEFISAGTNTVAVMVCYCGENFSTMMRGAPGLSVRIKAGSEEIITDEKWKCRKHPAFRSGRIEKVTGQLGFVFCFDARRDDEQWIMPEYDDTAWKNAVAAAKTVNGRERTMMPRPILHLNVSPRADFKVVRQGFVMREKEHETFALTCKHDRVAFDDSFSGDEKSGFRFNGFPSENDCNGAFLIADLGGESAGFIDIELEAPEGCVVDISHGEHLTDGVVRHNIGGRNFTDRYICRSGLNRFYYQLRRIGGRYIQLTFTNLSGDLLVRYAGIRHVSYPLPEATSFHCDLPDSMRLRDVAIRTMELCMHDHYEDCPWREQALYSYDSRSQMLFGYYTWGNYDFAAASLDLLGRGIGTDGHLNLCAPNARTLVIPIFSFVWISALYEYTLYSGDMTLVGKYLSQIKFMLDSALSRMNDSTGLCHAGNVKGWWHFYEWAKGLDNWDAKPAEDEFNALHNLYLCEALDSFSRILEHLGKHSEATGYEAESASIKAAVEKTFRDSAASCYATTVRGCKFLTPYHEHTQLMMLCSGAVPEQDKARLVDSLGCSGKYEPLTLSPLIYMLRGLASVKSRKALDMASEKVHSLFAPMLEAGATSLWETPKGGEDFGGAGSLCHAWSSVPVYYYGAVTLGVTPLEPGFKKFRLAPYTWKLTSASGEIPTPHGKIKVSWVKDGEGKVVLNVSHPAETEPVPELSPEFKTCNIVSE